MALLQCHLINSLKKKKPKCISLSPQRAVLQLSRHGYWIDFNQTH